jgi:hypothetical protein
MEITPVQAPDLLHNDLMSIRTLDLGPLSISIPQIGKVSESATPINVRFGSKADICTAAPQVRFTPKSGHVRRASPCLLWANTDMILPVNLGT